MDNNQVEQTEHAEVPAAVSVYPALSISRPPPRRERAMSFVLSALFASAFALAVAGFIEHYLHAP